MIRIIRKRIAPLGRWLKEVGVAPIPEMETGRGALESKIEAADKSDSIYALQLTMRGWEKYAELKEIRTGSRTAFMAMKFGDPQLDQVVDAYFKNRRLGERALN